MANGRLRSSIPPSFTEVEMLETRDLVYFPSYIQFSFSDGVEYVSSRNSENMENYKKENIMHR